MYNPVTDSFTQYESVKPNKVILPTMENIGYQPDITDIGIPTEDGNVIMKPARSSLISPEEIFTPQENVSVDVVIPKQEEERPTTPPENTSNNKVQKSSRINNTPIVPKNDWVRQLAQAYRNLGVSENGIRNLIVKNALESNWGKSAQGRYNYGNLTTGSSWKGNYVNGHDRDSKGRPIRNKFRSYNSIEEFAKDEVEFLKRLYDFDDNDDIDTFINKLLGGNKGKRRYAEDPKYSNKLKQIYKNL